MRWKLSILIIFLSLQLFSQRYTISGFVNEAGSKESLIGVNISVQGKSLGTATNNYGFYSITLASDSIELIYSFVGYQSQSYKVFLDNNIDLNVNLAPNIELEAIEVRADQPANSSQSSRMGVIEIPVQQVKALPTLLGEKDLLKVIQLMPGVKKGSEGGSGFYVRGGGPDQNLIILDDATVYNAYHLFGFVSLFNGDAIKSIELVKGGFPARYGGRLSSVLDINMKDGSKDKYSGEAGIGILSSRAVFEGPIVKDKASFLVSGRRSYLDILMMPFISKNQDTYGGYFFYDFTAKANWEIDKKNKIYVSGYFGRDKFYIKDNFLNSNYSAGLYWQNATTSVRWNRVIHSRLFSNLSFIHSLYQLKIYNKESYGDILNKNIFEMEYSSGIRDLGLKYDFSWMPAPNHNIKFGAVLIQHAFKPSAIVLRDDNINLFEKNVHTIYSIEACSYIEDEIKIKNRARLNLGGRISNHILDDGSTRSHIEPRLSSSYYLSPVSSLKLSYAVMNQYLHLLSNTGLGLPTDLWVPATSKVPAQNSWQTAFGYAYDFNKIASTFSIEAYYKEMNRIITYRPGASFLLIEDFSGANEISWEDNVIEGRGESYGIEALFQRRRGRFNGWFGYTLSWTIHQFDELNYGKPFFAKYDRRHDISIVAIYELTDNLNISATWVYGTGNALTIPIASYQAVQEAKQNYLYPIYVEETSSINGFRMAPYHRMDLGIQRIKKSKDYTRIWEFSFYNVYNRKNPFYYNITKETHYDEKTGKSYSINKLQQVSLFPIIPSFSYSIKF